ncbi:unnamed protein product, partial [Lymnaea stagnalis]
LLPRIIVSIRKFFLTCLTFVMKKTKGYLVTILLLVGYLAYFIAAMCYRFDDEGSRRLLGCTILGVVIAARSHIKRGFNVFLEKVTGSSSLTPVWKKRENTARFFLRWLMYGACTGVMVWVIVDKAIKEPNNLRSLPGIVIIMFICLCFSTAPNKVNYHTIFWSVGLQFLLSLFILNWKTGKDAIWWLQSRIDEFFDNSDGGSKFMFGQNYKEHFIIFGAMPLLLFTNGMMTLLYYCGVMQFIITVFGNFLNFILDTSPVESMAVAAGTFMEGITALTAFRPYLKSLTKSQLFLVITSCFSSIGSAFLAILAQMGVSIELIIGAMLISAPATFTICKLMFPETSKKKHVKILDIGNEEKSKYVNWLDAFQEGSFAMLPVVGNIVVSGFTFVCLISWVNNTLAWFGDRVGIAKLSIELIFSYVLYPVPLAMGVAPEDCRRVAMLFGYRLGSTNIVAFFKLERARNNRLKYLDYMLKTGGNGTVTYVNDDVILDQWGVTLPLGFISERSEAIITYALCGLSGMLSVAIHLAMMGAFLPKRRKWLSEIAMAALVAGNLANCLTGCFACEYSCHF